MRNKLYILVPVVALALFFGVFTAWRSHDRVARAERAAAERAELIAKREAEETARKAAFADAIAAQEKRRAERAERDARRKADETARAELLDQRDALAVRIGTSRRELAELTASIENERDAVATLQAAAAGLASDKKSLVELTAKAAANQTAITALLTAPTAPAPTANQR